MTTEAIVDRLTLLEEKVAALARQHDRDSPDIPWWESIAGTFADSPDYEEAMKLGRAYRQSLFPVEDMRNAGA